MCDFLIAVSVWGCYIVIKFHSGSDKKLYFGGVCIFSLLKHYLHMYLCMDVNKFYNLERGGLKFNITVSIVLRL